MIAGLEGRFAWTPAGAEEAAIVLNELVDDEGNEVWPRYRLRRISGLMGGGDPEDNRAARVGGIGETAERSERRGKTVTFEGVIEAKTLKQLRAAEADLRAAFAADLDEGRMDVTWHPSNEDFAEEPAKFFEARPLTCEIIDVQDQRRWTRIFVIGLRMSDPRYFAEADVHTVEVSETGSPETLKLTPPTNARGPILTLTLPAMSGLGKVIITNKTTKASLTLNLTENWDGSDLILDWHRRTIEDEDGVDRSAILDPDDNALWADLEPLSSGANELEVEIQVRTAPASAKSVKSVPHFGEGAPWSNPENARLHDAFRATATISDEGEAFSEQLMWKEFFPILLPAGATPTKIRVEVERSAEGTAVIDDGFASMVVGETPTGTVFPGSDPWPSADTYAVYEGSELYGLTEEQVESGELGFCLTAQGQKGSVGSATARVNHAQVSIYYAIPIDAAAEFKWETAYY